MILKNLACLSVIAVSAAFAACDTSRADQASERAAETAASQDVAGKAEKLEQLYARYWEEHLELHPLAATFQGDPRYNDRLPNLLSEDYREKVHDFRVHWLNRIQAVGPEGLEGEALISYQIIVRDKKEQLAGEEFPDWMQPVNQFYNLAAMAVQLGSGTSAQPFETVEAYEDWRQRASHIPRLFDQAIANMKTGVEHGVVQPTSLMENVVTQLDNVIEDEAEETLFWRPIENMPDSFSPAERERITENYRELIEEELMPAYRELRSYVAEDYMEHTRDSAGLLELPNGTAWYTYLARRYTTTDLSPAKIHQIGLREVERIQDEIRNVMDEVGFEGDMQEFFDYMKTAPRFSFESEEALLEYYRSIEDEVMKKVPELFSRLPEAGFEIRPVEAFRAKSAAGGSYRRPSADGSRPGVFYVNTYDLATRKKWDAEDLFLHEAIPGHHFQIAIQQELEGLPAFRRFGGETAFTEGWGLYAESLGRELDVYDTPYSYFGYLQNQLWRAIRLVVDTGLHAKGWSREKVIDYMLENSAESRSQAVAEAERYMAIPGQALAYKIGALTIQRLRDEAASALGDAFDIRDFHRVVLGSGSLPMDILEAKVQRWIAQER